jgi:MFS family permease
MTAGRFGTRATWLLQYPDIAGIFALTALFHVLYGPFVVGLPLLVAARTGASSTATVLGALWSAFGLGAVLGGLLAGHRLSLATARTAALIAAGWGGVTVVVALPAHLGVAVVAMLVGGMIYAPYLAIVSTIMQHRLHRRRLAEASAYLSSLTGLAGPFGTLLGGVTVAVAGARWTLTAAGGTLVAVGVGFAVRFGATTAPRTPGGTVAGDEATQGVGT